MGQKRAAQMDGAQVMHKTQDKAGQAGGAKNVRRNDRRHNRKGTRRCKEKREELLRQDCRTKV